MISRQCGHHPRIGFAVRELDRAIGISTMDPTDGAAACGRRLLVRCHGTVLAESGQRRCGHGVMFLDPVQGGGHVGQQVLDVLDAHMEAHHLGRQALLAHDGLRD